MDTLTSKRVNPAAVNDLRSLRNIADTKYRARELAKARGDHERAQQLKRDIMSLLHSIDIVRARLYV